MFDFYKELFFKINGIEVSKVKTNDEVQKEKSLFSKKEKIVILMLGVLYIFVAVIGLKKAGKGITVKKSKYLILLFLDLVSLLFTFLKTKQNIAKITITLFVICYFIFALKF